MTVIESTPATTDRKVVMVVVFGLVAIVMLNSIEYAVLAKLHVKLEILMPVSNLAFAALGSLGTLLATTRSSPPGPTTDPEQQPEPQPEPEPQPPVERPPLGPGQVVFDIPPRVPDPPAVGFFGGGD